jgi:glycosyltransferase 2 family protein
MRTRGGLGRAALGVGISVVALFLVVRSVDLGVAWSKIQAAQPAWLLALLLFLAIDVGIRAVRWRVLLSPVGRVSYADALGSLLVGYLANNVLPARLGEFVRSHDMGERTRLSKSTILGTIVVERVMDTLVVVVIASLAIFVLSVRGVVASAILVGFAITALLVVAIVVGLVAHRLPGADRAAAFINQWPRVHGLLVRLRTGLAVTGNLRVMAISLLLTLLSWSCTVLAFAAAAQSVGVQPTMGQAALLAAGVNLATAVPAGPGYVGTFEAAGVAIAASVGIDKDHAFAFIVLVHVFSLLITSIGGAVALLVGGRRRARSGAPVTGPGSRT